jgi:hypothetical protein
LFIECHSCSERELDRASTDNPEAVSGKLANLQDQLDRAQKLQKVSYQLFCTIGYTASYFMLTRIALLQRTGDGVPSELEVGMRTQTKRRDAIQLRKLTLQSQEDDRRKAALLEEDAVNKRQEGASMLERKRGDITAVLGFMPPTSKVATDLDAKIQTCANVISASEKDLNDLSKELVSKEREASTGTLFLYHHHATSLLAFNRYLCYIYNHFIVVLVQTKPI